MTIEKEKVRPRKNSTSDSLQVAKKELEDTRNEIRKEIIEMKDCLTALINEKFEDFQTTLENLKCDITKNSKDIERCQKQIDALKLSANTSQSISIGRIIKEINMQQKNQNQIFVSKAENIDQTKGVMKDFLQTIDQVQVVYR